MPTYCVLLQIDLAKNKRSSSEKSKGLQRLISDQSMSNVCTCDKINILSPDGKLYLGSSEYFSGKTFFRLKKKDDRFSFTAGAFEVAANDRLLTIQQSNRPNK